MPWAMTNLEKVEGLENTLELRLSAATASKTSEFDLMSKWNKGFGENDDLQYYYQHSGFVTDEIDWELVAREEGDTAGGNPSLRSWSGMLIRAFFLLLQVVKRTT